MNGGDGKPRPKAPAAAPAKPAAAAGPKPVPQKHAPRGTSDSLFDLAPVGKPSVNGLPRVPTVPTMPAAKNPFSDQEKTAKGGSALNLPKVASSASSQNLQPVGPTPGLVQPPRRKSNVIQKRLNASAFDDEEHTQLDAVLGRAKSVELDLDEVQTNTTEFYDGETPAPECTEKETWRALDAPVQSRVKRRSARLLWTLIDQFAAGHNPRYQVSNPAAEPKAHVFAWDVSKAMDCEIPHNRGGREMTLAQTVDWVRYECEFRGWKRSDPASAIAAADRGELVLVIAKDPRSRAIGVVRPGGVGDDGKARVASAGRPKGNDLGLVEAIGRDVEFFVHP
ncbi:MAG: hypothetical protein ACOZQL_00785 [Myxococcota bacterium]